MKTILLFISLVAPLCAQWIVNDPINTMVNTAVQTGQVANHLEVMRQWAEQLENLNRQLRQLQDQLAVQQRIRDVLGDPTAAGASVVMRDLGATDLARTYGDTLAATRRLANAIESLRRTSEGIYQALGDKTSLGRDFERQGQLYLRFAAVERQADTMAAVQAQTEERAAGLQADIAATLEQMRTATTQAEVDKLNGKLAVLNGQLVRVDAQRRDEEGKLHTQQILNDNQAAKERQDLFEKQLAEERQTLPVVGAWQEGIKLNATDYTPVKRRMYIFLSIALAGLATCGLLVLRHAIRHAPVVPATDDMPKAPRRVDPIDRWQGTIRVDTRTDYPSEPMRQLLLKLKQEEIRQRPQEGRN